MNNVELKALVEELININHQSYTIIDKNGLVIYWSAEASNIFQIPKEEIIGKPINQFFKKKDLIILQSLKKAKPYKKKEHFAGNEKYVDIISKPIIVNNEVVGAIVTELDVSNQVHNRTRIKQFENQISVLEQQISEYNNYDAFGSIIGNSSNMTRVKHLIKKAAKSEVNTLITGESGVGKELFSRSIHDFSNRYKQPFISVNCGTIPANLFESEIFGYEKGAFSGANQKGKEGLIERANNGTLFLDEIADMPLEMQVKLLRVIQEKKFYRVGSTKERSIDIRIVAATNKDLVEEVHKGTFREDLFYRLNVVNIEIPPLRDRNEDIETLSYHFFQLAKQNYEIKLQPIPLTLIKKFKHYYWPGNVRELRNIIERLVIFSEEGFIQENIFDDYIKFKNTDTHTFIETEGSLTEQLDYYEGEIIKKVFEQCNRNKRMTALNLGISRPTLYAKLSYHNIT
ncbi:sigma-54 interaction domain-containing protein [Staphylococcus kloosii]|jgi:transcriptional regulator with PAS, ATPase and Fis domain|uniref:sigma-54 interaction domain-containing protein n=1 Tax=Staphylococcus kloosii TaxID=29384 RepID=UPI00189C9C23|nr:sigma 54-interacting transcriptional regulator [Staphylococcus kloosii]MBF7025177.1 sigma 54-interacting transcriptional regulator [Staphylococcus kloosii]